MSKPTWETPPGVSHVGFLFLTAAKSAITFVTLCTGWNHARIRFLRNDSFPD